MNIAIIGSGNVGKSLAAAAVRAGHDVVISAAHPEHAVTVAQATGARSASSADAVAGAESVILAVPAHALDALTGELGAALNGKIVIDVTNNVNPQNPGSVLTGSSNAERIQARIPGAKVIKAFNTMFSTRMAAPVVDGLQIDGYVAGDDQEAKAAVLDFVRSIGIRPIDAGPLVMARALEGMGLLIVSLQITQGWPWQAAWKLIGPTGQAG
jgi:8-hydroxy-5-deazaflavin:NADPH oxidoreductase